MRITIVFKRGMKKSEGEAELQALTQCLEDYASTAGGSYIHKTRTIELVSDSEPDQVLAGVAEWIGQPESSDEMAGLLKSLEVRA